MKKVNYTLDDTRYWHCPNCDTINDTDVLDGIDMFPECEDCGKVFRWGEEEDKKKPEKSKGSMIRENMIDDSKMDYIEIIKKYMVSGFGIFMICVFLLILILINM